MRTNCIQQTVRMSVLSTLFALVAFSFLVVGGASAHTVSQTQASNQAQSLPTCRSNTVQIMPKRVGKVFKMAFSCNSLTVKVGTPVVFLNTTGFPIFITDNTHSFFLEVKQRATASLPTTQTGQLNLVMYGRPYPQAMLTVTVV